MLLRLEFYGLDWLIVIDGLGKAFSVAIASQELDIQKLTIVPDTIKGSVY